LQTRSSSPDRCCGALSQAFARLLAEQSKGGEFVDGSVYRHGKDATISFKRLEKADYRGLVLFNRERWASAEAELKGHSTRLAATGKFPPPFIV
jgi:hypothetical protein